MGNVPEPPSQVLGLVSAFLSEHGLETTSKALRKELKRKNLLSDFEPTQDGVRLQKIVESWNNRESEQSTSVSEVSEESDVATSASDSESSSATSSDGSDSPISVKAGSGPESDSEADSEAESSEDDAMEKATSLKKDKTNKRAASPTPSSSSSSDSDADDEDEDDEKVRLGRKKSPPLKRHLKSVSSLKRKAESSSPEASSSESESSANGRPAKRAKAEADMEATSSDASSSSESEQELHDGEASLSKSEEEESNDTDSSSGEESADIEAPPATLATGESNDSDSSSEEEQAEDKSDEPAQNQSLASLLNTSTHPASDSSSNTVMGDVVEAHEYSVEAENSRSGHNKQAAARKKHVGARPTPLAQLAAHATSDSHISNAYRSYDYADRAYNDLSITRGKGFTKEKNKKKRGSYRGGAIDISGGKGFKFDD